MSFHKNLAFKNFVAIFLLIFYFTLTYCNSNLKVDNEFLKKNFFNKSLVVHNNSIANSSKFKKVEILSTNIANISLNKIVDFKDLKIKSENKTILKNQFKNLVQNITKIFGQKKNIKNLTKNDKQQSSTINNLKNFRFKRTTTKSFELNYHDYLPSYRTTASANNEENFSEKFYSTTFKDKFTDSNIIYKYSPTQKYSIKPNIEFKHINLYTTSSPFYDLQSSNMPNEKKTNQYNFYFPNKKKKKKKHENTASSILPLLLFDKHQLAQEEFNNFKSTLNPFSTKSVSYNHNTPSTTESTILSSYFSKPLNSSKIQNLKKSNLMNVNFNKENNLIFNEKNSLLKLSNLNDYKIELNKNLMFGNTVWLKDNLNDFSDTKIEETHVPKSKYSNKNIPCLFCYSKSNYEKKNFLLNETKKSIQVLDSINKGYNLEKNNQNISNQFKIDKPVNENLYLFYEYYPTTFNVIENKSLKETEVELFPSLSSFLQVDRHHTKLGLHPIVYTNINSSFNNSGFFDNNKTFNQNSLLSPALQNILRISLALVIIITIIGNTLVCLSPIYFRKLRHPSNYLLISLALSDLGVALLVMPIALFSELHSTWLLGDLICDIWLGLDVVCCTASILHLCVICIDRYLTITRPFTYAVERRNSRSLFLISIVWLLSAFICLPPLLVLGNEHGTIEQPICEYCNNFGYQLYATLGAFYIPLFVMLILYYKIYVAAKKVIEAEHKSQCNSAVKSNLNSVKKNKKKFRKSLIEAHPTKQQYEMNKINFINKIKNYKKTSRENFDSKNCISCKQQLENFIVDCSIENPSSKENFTINTYTDNESFIAKPPENKVWKSINNNKSLSEIQNLDELKMNSENQKKEKKIKKTRNRTPKKLLAQKKFNTSQLLVTHEVFGSSNIINELCEKCLNELVVSCNNNLNDKNKLNTNIVNDNEINEKTIFNECVTTNLSNKNDYLDTKESLKDDKIDKPKQLNNKYKSMSTNCVLQINNQNCNKKVNHSVLRERKASITLGVIMCAFIFCWLPFFILALVRPFISERIPDWASSITLWLGYMNSMLNPIIYVTFHQDFRKAFKYIIICRCKIMKSSLRKEAYNVQYG